MKSDRHSNGSPILDCVDIVITCQVADGGHCKIWICILMSKDWGKSRCSFWKDSNWYPVSMNFNWSAPPPISLFLEAKRLNSLWEEIPLPYSAYLSLSLSLCSLRLPLSISLYLSLFLSLCSLCLSLYIYLAIFISLSL